MRTITYEKYRGGLVDALNVEELLDRLSDFLLDSGFGGWSWNPYTGEPEESDGLDALKDAILRALIESDQLTPEMLEALRGEGEPDAETVDSIARLLDDIVQRLVDEGYLHVDRAPRAPDEARPVTGAGSIGKAAVRSVKFELSRKSLDFLGYRALRSLLGSYGQAGLGAHDTQRLATGVEAEAGSKPYEFGDTLNLDVPATLRNTIARAGLRFPLPVEYSDLHVHQATYRSSCATVLMLDCSHSMILYGEDRFTPAKKVGLALSHLLRTQFPGDTLRCVLFHDSAEEIPLSALARAQVGPYHTNTAEGLRIARRILRSERGDMRQIIMITDGKPSAITLPGGRIYKNSMGLDRRVLRETYREVAACRREGIAINTFMLARSPTLIAFVRKVTEICRGKAFFTSTMSLGQYILMDYMSRKTRHVR
ncbi:MAG: VWA domain-containing protein [Gemmatimonadota bacterium]|nr:VWA domain-containing protein [Gemmatimonadota bacterium]